jgi:membrane protease YdiL (CAAX protease family)
MKTCRYCGRENDDQAPFCTGCGTSLITTERPGEMAGEQGLSASTEERLSGGRATIILLIYLGVQLGIGMVVTMVVIFLGVGSQQELQDQRQIEGLIQEATMPASILALIVGGAAMVLMSRLLIHEQLGDGSPTGAAWIVGTRKSMALGLGIGLVVGTAYYGLSIVLAPYAYVLDVPPGPITRMALTAGVSRWLWLAMALVLAPPIEELLFRGVVYGGYRKSLGAVWAAILTTSIFCVLHVTEVLDFWPSVIGIIGLAVAALWLRLRSAAIGPAVAVHFGYNAVIAVMVFMG